jgi:hypothetical protein
MENIRKRSQHTNQKKFTIVVELLRGSPAEWLCKKYHIPHTSTIFRWQAEVLKNGHKVFEKTDSSSPILKKVIKVLQKLL